MLKLLTKQIGRQLSRQYATTTTAISATASQKIDVAKSLGEWRDKLRDAGVGDIDFNLKCLVAHVLKRKFNLLPNYENVTFSPEQYADFRRLCEARCARMPLQYIIGEWDFMDITLKTAPSVFIPRPETEEFVHKVITQYADVKRPINLLEVGCGSGAISLAILNALPHVNSTAIERSKVATVLAFENAQMLGLQDRFRVFNHTMEQDAYLPSELQDSTYDLIVSNPPYVKSHEFQHLQPEIMVYENLNALDGGPDGLRIARVVCDLASVHLRSGGKLWMELASDHPPLVKTLMSLKYEGKLKYISGHYDQYKQERFVEIEKV